VQRVQAKGNVPVSQRHQLIAHPSITHTGTGYIVNHPNPFA
jgi:hypothetical protein